MKHLLGGAFSLAVLGGVGWLLYRSIGNSTFVVDQIEWKGVTAQTPLRAPELEELSGVKRGQTPLSTIDGLAMARRLEQHAWVRSVDVRKEFPDRLIVFVQFEEPLAVWAMKDGQLRYIDRHGRAFGVAHDGLALDLPYLFGPLAPEVLSWIEKWQADELSRRVELDSIELLGSDQFVIFLTDRKTQKQLKIGTDVKWVRSDTNRPFRQLSRVFSYLDQRSIDAKELHWRSGEKIVVKTNPGS